MRAYKIAPLIFLVIVVTVAATVGASVIRIKRFSRGYEQIEAGMPKQRVIELMGQPSKALICDGPLSVGGKVVGRCSERYEYHGLMSGWLVFFDDGGRVIWKYYSAPLS